MFWVLALLILSYVYLGQTKYWKISYHTICLYALFIAGTATTLGNDFESYVQIFELKIPYDELLLMGWPPHELLFYFAIELGKITTLEVLIFPIITLIFIELSMNSLDENHRKTLSMIFISTYIVVVLLNGLRLGLGISIVLYIIIKVKGKMRPTLAIITALATHSSMLVPIILNNFSKSLKTKSKRKLLIAFIFMPIILSMLLGMADSYFQNKIALYISTENYASSLGFISVLIGSALIGRSFNISRLEILFVCLIVLIPFIILDNAYLLIRVVGLLPITFFIAKIYDTSESNQYLLTSKRNRIYFTIGTLIMTLITIKPLILEQLSPQYIY